MSLLHRVHRRIRRALPQYAEIGRHRIRLPRGSMLNEYRSNHRHYDFALGEIAAVVYDRYPTLHAIDIGANVGDTAALIRIHTDIPVLCIEGDAALLPLLRRNAASMGPSVEIEPSFVGCENVFADLSRVSARGLNASLVDALAPEWSANRVRFLSLETIVRKHSHFINAKLLKIDTEGFDFDIIRSSTKFLQRARPVLFFEYDPSLRSDALDGGIRTLDFLIEHGYCKFLYYDNFGNLLLELMAAERTKMADLHAYLASNRRFGVAIYYFDICAIHKEDAEIVADIKRRCS